MKCAHLADPRFQQAFDELAGVALPMRQAYDISRIGDFLTAETRRYEKLRLEMLRRHAEKDAAGEMIVQGNGRAQLTPEALTAFQAELQELCAVELELPVQLPMDALPQITLTPMSVGLLVDAGVLVA